MQTTQINELAELWRQTKAAEDAHRADRIKIEEELAALVNVKEEGASTTKTDLYKITAKGNLNRSVDWKQYDTIRESIPEQLRPVKLKPELDIPGLRWLESNEPALYRIMVQCITTKPGKTGFAVEPIGDK